MILGEKCITLWGKDTITDYIDKFKFNISPLSFSGKSNTNRGIV